VVNHGGEPLREALLLVAPGMPLREGLDRVLQAKRGALVVLGDDPAVLSICTGGFLLDAEFSPQRLSELAKMDGAIILAPDASRIARANVHLMPRASIPTRETGTRHRTAERVARSVDVTVITVSEAMATIAVYRHDRKHVIQRTSRLLDRSGQALATLNRFKRRFDLALAMLSTLEVEDSVSVRDVVAVLQPGEMMVRIAEEIRGFLVELGDDGRLISLQLEELVGGTEQTLTLMGRDYLNTVELGPLEAALDDEARHPAQRNGSVGVAALRALPVDDVLEDATVAEVLALGTPAGALDAPLEARGYRLLHQLPRLSETIIDRVVERFGTLGGIMRASLGDLETVGGVGDATARTMKDGLTRIVEASILERYD
jgi:diadenylate cyclase